MRKILKPARIATALGGAMGGICLFAAVFGGQLTLSTTLAQAQTLPTLGAGPAAPLPSGRTPGQDRVQAAYQVTDVPVDATASNAAQAREVALADGQVKALGMLFQRLVDPSYASSLPHPSAKEVDQMVLRLSIREEKTSAVRYLGKIDVSFMPQAVKAMLDRAHVPYIETAARPTLVLPVWYNSPESAPMLWEEPNPWRQAWVARRGGGLVSTEVPLGDLSDVSVIDAAKAVALDGPALEGIAQRYAAESILIAEAKARKTPESIASNPDLPEIDVRIRRPSATAEQPITVTVLPEPGEDLTRLLTRAVGQAAQALDQGFRGAAMAEAAAGPVSETPVLLSFDTLAEWIGLRQNLDHVQGLKGWQLSEVRRTSARAVLRYTGTFEELRAALGAVGIAATLEQDGWTLHRDATTSLPGGNEMPSIIAPSSGGATQSSQPAGVAPAAGYPGSQSSVTIR